jgi:DnaJ-domain-containing protein 1
VGTYLIWADATGRIAARARRRAARRERARSGGRRPPPGGGRRRVADGVGGGSARTRRERRRAPTADDGPSAEEARRVLGVPPGAEDAEIKRAYRERAKEVHPDQADGDEEAFKRATAAYERLREE